ncbi:ABC-2 type transport system permease protein [Methanofollis sp. W23]|uniref:ABC transporter permease n=1 Tax=Methanofollis sp. W23 TaxID=2817849 RepID=UPI001AE1E553|nr:ABC transporter permease subunit [Methanofollis sp. W23]MBP2146934.1 ABC-2 type transport system permease protein [Methanofollis sp. W23]
MSSVITVARKEVKAILTSRQTIISAIIVVVLFSLPMAPAITALGTTEGGAPIDQALFMFPVLIGVFLGYIFAGQVFLREKTDGTIETLLCAPISLRNLWAGKVVGTVIPAYALTLIGVVLIIGAASSLGGGVVLPSLQIIVHLLVVVPAYIAFATGGLGFIQLLLGLKENQIVNVVVIFVVIFSFSLVTGFMGSSFSVGWGVIGTLLAVAAALLGILAWATRFLDKERIVTTIP